MSISLSEVSKHNLISPNVIKLLPHKCKCGSNLEFSDSLRTIKCSNKLCVEHMINRTFKLCEKLNIKIRYEDIEYIAEAINMISPYQILLLDEAISNKLVNNSKIPNISAILEQIKEARCKEYFIHEIVGMCGVETLEVVANKIAYGFNSIDELYNEIDGSQLAFVNERLGVKTSDGCALTIAIYTELLEIRDELIFAESLVNIKKTENRIFIAFNDNAEPFTNKSELIGKINDATGLNFVQVSVISRNTDILVRNTNTHTAKYRAARMVNDGFIAEQVNNGLLELSEVGKEADGQLKPVGYAVYIDDMHNIIKKINKLYGVDIHE